MRWLLHLPGEAVSATKLARRAKVSQPRASQVLSDLVDLDLVDHPTRFEWRVHRKALLARFLDEYRGPRGTTRYFYTLTAPSNAASALAATAGKAKVYISGDVGADLLAAYRSPSHLVAYQLSDLRNVPDDWVEAAGPGDANIRLVSPSDDSVATLPLSREFKGTTIELADPTQILWDLHRDGGEDRIEAAEVLERWLLSTPYTS